MFRATLGSLRGTDITLSKLRPLISWFIIIHDVANLTLACGYIRECIILSWSPECVGRDA